jgi:hypothetical protein
MSFTSINLPSTTSFVSIDTRTGPNKVIMLPAASTVTGRLFTIKDQYGGAALSTYRLSTIGMDKIDGRNWIYTFSNAFGAISFLSDGRVGWRVVGLYDGSSTALPVSSGPINLNTFGTLAVWSDATSFSTNNQSLTTWTNKATSTSHTVNCGGTVLTGTLNSLPIVRLTTSQTWRPSPDVNLPAYTLFWVGRQRGGSNSRVLTHVSNNQLYGYWGGYKRSFYIDGNPANHVTAFASDSAWDMFSHSRTAGSAYTFNWNGTSTYTGSSSSGNNMTGLGINIIGENSDCDVAEIALYSVVLTSTQIQIIEGYLAWKWGLQTNLPVGHPYRSAAPT